MLAIQVQYWANQEVKRHNKVTEKQTNRQLDQKDESIRVDWYNAESNRINANANMMNAETNRMNVAINQQNANTNWYNAETNRMNAFINQQNANTNAAMIPIAWANAGAALQQADAAIQNAETNRMNAETNQLQLAINQQNADSQTVQADASKSNANTNWRVGNSTISTNLSNVDLNVTKKEGQQLQNVYQQKVNSNYEFIVSNQIATDWAKSIGGLVGSAVKFAK